MLEWIAAVLPPLVAAILLWSGSSKLFTRRGKLRAQSTALTKLVGENRASLAYRSVGAGEAILALLLLVPQARPATSVAVVCVGIGFLAFLTYSRVTVPEASCGCMSAKSVPISWRTFTRAAWILVSGLIMFAASDSWFAAIAAQPVLASGALLALAVSFVMLSAEFDGAWLIPLRRLRVKFTHPLAGDTTPIPLEHSTEQIYHSEAYKTVNGLLRTSVRETWEEEDEWRLVVFGALIDDRATSAVFAVPLHRHAPDEVIVAMVDDETGETVMRIAPHEAPPNADEPETVPSG